MTIEKLENYINQSKQREASGVELSRQSVENYISEVLDMDIIESSSINYEDDNGVEVVAKSRREGIDSTFTFLSTYYAFDEFKPRADSITLMKVEGEEGAHEIEQKFYLTKHAEDFNRNHKLFNTPLSKIISGEIYDEDLRFVINMLKDRLKNSDGYKYVEDQNGNIKSFSIVINKDIKIEQGMSNTIQVSFRNKRLDTIQIIYNVDKDKVIKQVNRLVDLIEEYSKWDIKIDDKHSISKLYDSLESRSLSHNLVTSSLIKRENNNYINLFGEIVIGKWASYSQTGLVINYNCDKGEFELTVNYLFKTITLTCNNVKEVVSAIDDIIKLIG